MQTATADPLVGRLLEGRYRILERIARGGMSTVYAAVDERLDRRVAVKVMSSTLSSDPKFSDRFTREARAAARLTHVNAVSVYDQGVDTADGANHVFLVMELVQGRTLRDLMRERQGRFTAAEAISIMEPVLSALSAAHRAGMIHRDVKPENILLSDDGLVKVADFGLAHAVDADAASTRTGLMMGTVAYCAPEQLVHGRSDQRSDVYSAGILLFELLTGRQPYQGESAMNVAFQHVHSRVPAPSSRVKGIATAIDEIVVAATDSDPSGRPADASVLLAEIADARSELELPIVPIPPRLRTNVDPTRAARPGARPSSSSAPTAPVQPAHSADTEVLGGAANGRFDTRVVGVRPQSSGRPLSERDGPPPPVVIPPSRRDARSPRARRWRRRIVVLIVLLLLAAASVAGGIAGVHAFKKWDAHVPRVAGLAVPSARSALQRRGYTIDENVTSEFSETVPIGVVIATVPTAGERVPQGKSIRLLVSRGKNRVPVPDLDNLTLSAAQSTLQSHGLFFDANPVLRTSITVAKDSVISTNPPAGTSIKPNQRISFIVSAGLPTVDIPSISTGTSFDAAQSALHLAKFKVREQDDFDDDVPAGEVLKLTPTDRALYGSTVTVHVSKGPEFVTVPNPGTLEAVSTYQAQLEQLGLQIKIKPFLGAKDGWVWKVNPKAGTPLHPGSVVTVQVI